MVEYISREAVLKCIENDGYEEQYDLGYYAHNREFQELIKEIPAADVKPVVLGWWEWDVNGMDWNLGSWKCSQCHARPETTWQGTEPINPLAWSGSSYCPNCGADMREVEK